jgi:hypothetical protein
MFFLCADLGLTDALSWRHHLHRHRHRMSNNAVRRRGSASDVACRSRLFPTGASARGSPSLPSCCRLSWMFRSTTRASTTLPSPRYSSRPRSACGSPSPRSPCPCGSPPADAAVLTFCMNSYTTWTPGNPTCSTSSSCSSGKVAGLLFFATFSYIWTTQVVGNVTLATLAGGPYGSTPDSLFCYHMDSLFSRLVLLRPA